LKNVDNPGQSPYRSVALFVVAAVVLRSCSCLCADNIGRWWRPDLSWHRYSGLI